MNKHFLKNSNCLTPFQKVSLCDLAYTFGTFLNRRSELKKLDKRDSNINQRYYESYCALLGAIKVLGLRLEVDYNGRFVDFYKVDTDIKVLSVPISKLVYERFDEYSVMEKKINSDEIAVERINKNTEVE